MQKGGLRFARIAACFGLVGAVIFAITTATGSAGAQPKTTTVTLSQAHPYTPDAPAGATDDYHCTLINPHLTQNSFIVSSQFFPGSGASSVEVHHAILFLVPQDLAAEAEQANAGGKGWTCFGETPLPNTSLAQIGETPWLSAWAPGHGLDVLPTGTGAPVAKGSLVVMQIHYNLLLGDKPVTSKLQLTLVPGTTPLKPLSLDLLPAPPDVPCPTGVTGPLCDRTASLQNLGERFGQSAVGFVDVLERICGRNPDNPPVGDTTSCTWPVPRAGNVVRLGAHMHLLGRTLKITLDPGTPQQKVLLNVTNYNFHYQKGYNLSKPVAVKPGDTFQVTCSYDPQLHEELPALRSTAPHFVTWGDGSTDEMCLGLVELAPATGASNKVDWARV